jgi:hypothetical protein
MAIARPDYSCRYCGHCPSEQEIAITHFTSRCTACNGAISLDAPGALTRSRGAALAGVAGMVIGVSVCVALLSVIGVSAEMIATWPKAWRLGMGIGVFFIGFVIAFAFQRAWVKRMLAKVHQQLKDDGTI